MQKILVIILYFLLDALHVSDYISPSSGATFISCTSHLVYAGICRYVWLLCGYRKDYRFTPFFRQLVYGVLWRCSQDTEESYTVYKAAQKEISKSNLKKKHCFIIKVTSYWYNINSVITYCVLVVLWRNAYKQAQFFIVIVLDVCRILTF